jgi:predicted RNA binding protein YcfA (HicA-like mRNA interferase family)
MAKLPCVSGARVVKALERLGFVKRRQRGSHVVLRRGSSVCVVPLHR